jgi:hypothetical protein
MLYKLTAYTIAQLLTWFVAVVVSIIIWKRRNSRGGWPLFLLFVAVAEWALCNGLEAAAVPQELKIFWSKVAYLGTQTSLVLLVLFALQYNARGKRITLLTSDCYSLSLPYVPFGNNEMQLGSGVAFLPGRQAPTASYIITARILGFIAYIFTMVSVGTADPPLFCSTFTENISRPEPVCFHCFCHPCRILDVYHEP